MSPQRSIWASTDIGDQSGRTAVVTGANTGLGFEVASTLAAHGGAVVLACRDDAKAATAAARITAATPGAVVDVVRLDLGSLDSVRAAAERIRADHQRLDLLVNNAGVMWLPLGHTADGFERHLGINHLGHFALTGLLFDRLLATPASRIVTVSSNGHKQGDIDLDDPHFAGRRYRPMAAYAQSKLANLMFTYELQRRLARAGATTAALAAHPGGSRTELTRHMPVYVRVAASRWLRWMFGYLVQDAAAGAEPILRAAMDPAANGGEYYGPGGRGEWTGLPVLTTSSDASHDADTQRRLWAESERLTGVTYDFTATSPPVHRSLD